MTEITRVPLQPIAKGALGKLWIGVAAAVLAAAGLAHATLPPSVSVETLKAGAGASPTVADVVLVNYKGTLPNGKVFDEGRQVFPMEGMIPGFTKALEQMQRGGKYHVVIPAKLAYGERQVGEIPPNTDLTFEIELIDFRNRAEIEQQQRLIQQMQAAQGAAGGQGGEAAMPQEAPAPQGTPKGQ